MRQSQAESSHRSSWWRPALFPGWPSIAQQPAIATARRGVRNELVTGWHRFVPHARVLATRVETHVSLPAPDDRTRGAARRGAASDMWVSVHVARKLRVRPPSTRMARESSRRSWVLFVPVRARRN